VRLAAALLLLACQGGRPAPARDDARPAVARAAADAAEPVVPCPVPRSAEGTPIADEVNALLEAAHHAFEVGRHAEAWTCADRAADLEPRAVEAHHLRATALAALGRHADAELAYALALVIDPADPETLRAMADFEVSVRPDRPRDALRLGAELARRGRAALARKTADPKLEGELFVIEARAQSDLGRADLALALADKALARRRDDPDALYDRARALLDLLRFAEAEPAFRTVLAQTPDDPFAHDGLALALEWLGRTDEAAAAHARARALAPGELGEPVLVPEGELRADVDATLAALDPARRARLAQVPIVIADRPDLADLRAVDPPFPPTILGLYRGLPDGETAPDAPPRAIFLYRINLARAARSRAELREQVAETLLHEIGHFEGQDEDDLRRHGME
jgi:tetratricopeptide (TPR) repeat protein